MNEQDGGECGSGNVESEVKKRRTIVMNVQTCLHETENECETETGVFELDLCSLAMACVREDGWR